MQLSKAEIDLSNAEESVIGLEEDWMLGAKAAIIGLGGAMVYRVWLIILAVREEYVYNRNRKRL